MKPKKPSAAEKSQLQLFQARLDSQLNLDHPLVVLANLIDWNRFDQAYEPLFCPDNGAPALPTRLAKHHGIVLRQPYTRKAKQTARKASGYAAARQHGRLKQCVKDLKNRLGRVIRDIERKSIGVVLKTNFSQLIETAKKLLLLEKNTPKKIYSLHELGVQCIGKG